MVNDYGSEDLQATLTKNNDGTYKALDPSSHTVVNYNDGCTRILQYHKP